LGNRRPVAEPTCGTKKKKKSISVPGEKERKERKTKPLEKG